MGDRFFNAEHSIQKLNHTICLYKGIPYYITSDGDEEVIASDLATGKRTRIRYTDPEFDYTHIPLGYISTGGQAFYLTREPQRIVSQGLSPRSIRATPVANMRAEDLVIRKEFIKCVLGEHVSFEEAIKSLRSNEATSVSIGRHMAIIKQSAKIYMVDYRGRTVAISQNRGASFAPIEHKGAHFIVKRLRNHGVPVA